MTTSYGPDAVQTFSLPHLKGTVGERPWPGNECGWRRVHGSSTQGKESVLNIYKVQRAPKGMSSSSIHLLSCLVALALWGSPRQHGET